MHNFLRVALSALLLTATPFLVSATRAVAAPAMLTIVGHPPSNIKIARCEPTSGTTTVTPGFVPGYYPGRPFYWYDVYGRRFYQPAVRTRNPELAIDYTNEGSKVATTIEFGLVARGHLVAEVRDVGTFSPGAEIKHRFGISQNVFPLGTGMAQCLPLRITYQDGTKWRSRRLPALMAGR